MREILFKAKAENADGTKDWVEGYLSRCDNQFTICDDDGFGVFIDQYTICQYTGLTDKNGKKIFENDIVKCNYNYYGDDGIYVGKVIFRKDTCMFLITDTKSTDYEWWNEDKEVIGNIFDNPELIK